MEMYKGIDIHVCIQNDEGDYDPIAHARTASVSMQRDMIEVASPSTGTDKEYIPGRCTWKMSCGCLLSDKSKDLMTLYKNGECIDVSWEDADTTITMRGQAYIKSLKATGNIHEMATFDIELQGTGGLTLA